MLPMALPLMLAVVEAEEDLEARVKNSTGRGNSKEMVVVHRQRGQKLGKFAFMRAISIFTRIKFIAEDVEPELQEEVEVALLEALVEKR